MGRCALAMRAERDSERMAIDKSTRDRRACTYHACAHGRSYTNTHWFCSCHACAGARFATPRGRASEIDPIRLGDLSTDGMPERGLTQNRINQKSDNPRPLVTNRSRARIWRGPRAQINLCLCAQVDVDAKPTPNARPRHIRDAAPVVLLKSKAQCSASCQSVYTQTTKTSCVHFVRLAPCSATPRAPPSVSFTPTMV